MNENVEPEQPELDLVIQATMSHLLLAVKDRHRGKFNALLDAFASKGGTATHLIWALCFELASNLRVVLGEEWATQVYLKAVDVETELNAIVAAMDERESDEGEDG